MAGSLSAVQLASLASVNATDFKALSLNSADPGTTGANESTAPRQAIVCTSAAGVVTIPPCAFTGGAASGPVAWVSLWSATIDGSYLGKAQIISGDTNFNAAGQYDTASFTVTLS